MGKRAAGGKVRKGVKAPAAGAGAGEEELWGPGHENMVAVPWSKETTVMLIRLVALICLSFVAWQVYVEQPKRHKFQVYDKVVLADTFEYEHEVCDNDKSIDDETRCANTTVLFEAGREAVVIRVPGYEEDSPAVVQIEDYQLNAPEKGIVQFADYEKDKSLVKLKTKGEDAKGSAKKATTAIKGVSHDEKIEL